MCSDMEPDTSIRQNITAWATGFGSLEAAIADVDRIDVGDAPDPRLEHVDLRRQRCAALVVALVELGFERRDRLRPRSPQRNPPRHGEPHGAPDEIFAGEPDTE